MCPKSYYSPYHSDTGEITNNTCFNIFKVLTRLMTTRTRTEDRIRSEHTCSQNGFIQNNYYQITICSNGEQWLGLEYQYFVQKSHGPSPSKLVAYIASDRKTYQYVTYEKFAIGNWQKDYAITEIEGFDEDLDDITDMFQFPGNR
jgi:hypothetical protein